jgi:prepilin-type N-terminal cleavage/methylation domain-containing protein
MNKSNRGYSLIEVLIAMAIMGSVFLSIASLFYLGRRNVYSGKQMTQAVAVGTHVLEDFSQLTVSGVYSSFAVTDATALAKYKIDGIEYDNVFIRATASPGLQPCTGCTTVAPGDLGAEADPAPADATINGFLTTWRNELANNNKFQDGVVIIVVRPTDPATVPLVTPQNQPVATLLQIRSIVQWREAGRLRSVVVDTAKLRRP